MPLRITDTNVQHRLPYFLE